MATELCNIDFEEEIDIVVERWDPDGAIVVDEEDEVLDGCSDEDFLNILTVAFVNEMNETCVIRSDNNKDQPTTSTIKKIKSQKVKAPLPKKPRKTLEKNLLVQEVIRNMPQKKDLKVVFNLQTSQRIQREGCFSRYIHQV